MNTNKYNKKIQKSVSYITQHILLTRGIYVPLIPLCAVSARRGFKGGARRPYLLYMFRIWRNMRFL